MNLYRTCLVAALAFFTLSGPMMAKELPGDSVFHLSGNWSKADGAKITLADLQGKTLVLAMTYTSCQYSCPLIVEEIKRIKKQLPDNIVSNVSFVLASMDPARDTPKTLKAYAQKKKLTSPPWILLSPASEDQARELAAILGIQYKKVGQDFAHSNLITILDKEGVILYTKPSLGREVKETVEAIKKSVAKADKK